MTVSTQTSSVTYAGTGATVIFTVTFPFLANGDIQAVHRDAAGVETIWVENTQYTLTGAGGATGTLTVETTPTDYTPASGETITILRNMTLTQETDYVPNDPFPAETHEQALDKLTMIAQQLSGDIGQVIRASSTVYDNPSLEFNELAANRASKIVGFDSAGDLELLAPGSGTILLNEPNMASNSSTQGVVQSSLVTYTQNRRLSVFDYMTAAEIANVQSGSLSVDVTTALQAAWTAICASGGALHIQGGDYKLSARITGTTAKKVIIVGDGSGAVNLIWDSGATAGGGLLITYTDEDLQPHVSGLTLKNNDLAAGTALQITGPTAVLSTLKGGIITDIDVRGVDQTADCWLYGINIVNMWYPHLSYIHIKGQTTITIPMAMAEGIRFDQCMVPRFENITVFHANVAINQHGASYGEGVILTRSELVGCNYGVVLPGNSGSDGGNGIHDNHISTYTACIKMTNRHGLAAHDNLLFKAGGTADWTGIDVIGGGQNQIHDNSFLIAAGSTGANTGIQLGTASLENSVHDNIFEGWTVAGYGVFITGTSGDNDIHNNIGHTGVTAAILDVSTVKTNIFRDNYPTSAQVFTDGDATPSVGSSLSGTFQTANTGATTITNFDNGILCKPFELLINDANTTIQHNANISLQGGANYAPASGAILTFNLYAGGVWREVSRRTA